MTLFSGFYLICCVNKSMNFKKWLLSEDIWQGNTATVFHRTKSVKDVSGVLTSDYKTGAGCMYGCGLYTTFALESQFSSYMYRYGHAVIKFKVIGLDKYLIFQLSVAKQIHGEDYKISSQFKKLGLLNKPNVDESKLKEYDERQEKENYSSTLAREFYEQNKWIEKSVKGIIYYGGNDGYCLVKYEPVQDGTITMLGYAVADVDNQQKMEELKSNIGWITSTEKAKIKYIYSLPNDQKSKYNFIDKFIAQNINKFSNAEVDDLIEKRQNWFGGLEDLDNVTDTLLDNYKDQIEKVIIKHKKELSDSNVFNLLLNAQDKDQIAELLQQHTDNISKLSDIHVSNLLSFHDLTDKDRMVKIIIKHKKELSGDNVFWLLGYTKEIEEIAELLQQHTDNISKLSDKHIEDLYFRLRFKKNNKLAKILNKYYQNKTKVKLQKY